MSDSQRERFMSAEPPLQRERAELDRALVSAMRDLRKELRAQREAKPQERPPPSSFERGAAKVGITVLAGLILAFVYGAIAVDKKLDLLHQSVEANTAVIEMAHPRSP